MKSMHVDDPFPTTDEEALEYMPDDAHQIFREQRAAGASIAEAMVKAFDAVLSDGSEGE